MAQLFVSSIDVCRRREVSPPRTIILPTFSQADLGPTCAHGVFSLFGFQVWNLFAEFQWSCMIHVAAPLMTQVPVEINVRHGDGAPGALRKHTLISCTHSPRRCGRSERSKLPNINALLSHPRRAICRRRVVGPWVGHRQEEATPDIE